MKYETAFVNNLPKHLDGLEHLLPKDDSFDLKDDIRKKGNIEIGSYKNENKYSKLRNFCDEIKYIMNKSHNMVEPA